MEHTRHYVLKDWSGPHGGYMYMRQSSFMAVTAATFSLFEVSPQMDFEDACYWNKLAVGSGIVFC